MCAGRELVYELQAAAIAEPDRSTANRRPHKQQGQREVARRKREQRERGDEKRESGEHGRAGAKPLSEDEHEGRYRIELENDPAADRVAVQVQGFLEQAWRQRRLEAEQREGGEGGDGRRGECSNESARYANSGPQGKLSEAPDWIRLRHQQGNDGSGKREHHQREEG